MMWSQCSNPPMGYVYKLFFNPHPGLLTISGSSSSNKNKGQWPLAKYTHAVLDLLAAAIGPVKSDRALSDNPVKSDRASQSNNNEGLGYSPLNFIWMESVPFPLRNDLAVNQVGLLTIPSSLTDRSAAYINQTVNTSWLSLYDILTIYINTM